MPKNCLLVVFHGSLLQVFIYTPVFLFVFRFMSLFKLTFNLDDRGHGGSVVTLSPPTSEAGF